MSARVIGACLLALALISAINCEQETSDNVREKRTAPLLLSFIGKKFGYQLINQKDIFGLPNEIILRRVGYKPPRKQRPQAPPAQALIPEAPLKQNLAPQPAPQPQLPTQQLPVGSYFPYQFLMQPQNVMADEPVQQPPAQMPTKAPFKPLPIPQSPMNVQQMTVKPQQPQNQIQNSPIHQFAGQFGNLLPFPFPFPYPFPKPSMPAQKPTTQRPHAPATVATTTTQAPTPASTPAPPAAPKPTEPKVPAPAPQFPALPEVPVPQSPTPTVPAREIDLTAYQRKAPEHEPNYFGRQQQSDEIAPEFDYTAIDPRSKHFESFQFTSSADQQPQDQQGNDLGPQYENIASPAYDHQQYLTEYQEFNSNNGHVEPTVSAPATSNDQELYNNFAINVPEPQQHFIQAQHSSHRSPGTKIAPAPYNGFEYAQNQYKELLEPQSIEVPLQGPTDSFNQFESKEQNRGKFHGRILHPDQLKVNDFGKRIEFQPPQEQFNNRGSFNLKIRNGQNYDIQVLKSLELSADAFAKPVQSLEYGSRSSSLKSFDNIHYLPPVQTTHYLPPLQRRSARQETGQSTSSMSFRSGKQQYSVKTNHKSAGAKN